MYKPIIITNKEPSYTKIVTKEDKKPKIIKPIPKRNSVSSNPPLKDCLGKIDKDGNVKFNWEK